MPRLLRNRRIFYGWWIVAVCLLVLTVHSGCAFYSFAVLNKTLVEALGTSRAVVGGAVSLYLLTLGLTAPLVGKLTDRYGPKRVVLWGSAIAGAGLMLLTLTTAVWNLYILYIVVGIGMCGAGVVPVSVAVSNWFTKRRGTAMGIAMLGIALGALLLASLTSYLAAALSWRVAFFALGLLALILVIPGVGFVMRTRPQDMGLLPDGEKPLAAEALAAAPHAEAASDPQAGAWSLARALRSPAYWLVVAAFFLVSVAIAGVLQHEVAFLNDMGISMAVAGVALSVTGGMGGLGKLSFGFIADRIRPRYTAILCFALQIVGVVLLMLTQTTAMVWAFVIVFGFAMGGQIALQPLVTGELFGLASFGAVFSGVALGAAAGSALGPIMAGWIFDAWGSYYLAFLAFIIGYAMAITALLLIRGRKPKAISP